jgi:hypothetical protein
MVIVRALCRAISTLKKDIVLPSKAFRWNEFRANRSHATALSSANYPGNWRPVEAMPGDQKTPADHRQGP